TGASERRRNHDGVTLHKATPFLKREVSERSLRASKGSARWIIDGQVRAGACAVEKIWNRCGFATAEIGRIADEIPTLLILGDTGRILIVAAAANDAPWQGALDRHNRWEVPTLEHLAEVLLAWQGVSDCRGEASADIEIAARIVGPEISRRVCRPRTFSGRLVESVRPGEAEGVRKSMVSTLGQGDLRAVVVGKQR